jgi:hypothetical protein
MLGLIMQMPLPDPNIQTLLMEQARWFYHHWAIVSFTVGGIWAIWKKLRHLAKMLETASVLPDQLATHTVEDKVFQGQAMTLIQAEGAATRREIHEVMEAHVTSFHHKPAR